MIVEHQGTLWALAQVLSFDGKWTTLLVNIDFDGSISSVRTIVIDDHVGEYAEVNVLARSDAGTYVGGIITQLEGNRRYIARLAL